jgi:hypothetical protein
VGGVAGTPKIESFSAAGLPDFVQPRALPSTPRNALATAGGLFTSSEWIFGRVANGHRSYRSPFAREVGFHLSVTGFMPGYPARSRSLREKQRRGVVGQEIAEQGDQQVDAQ